MQSVGPIFISRSNSIIGPIQSFGAVRSFGSIPTWNYDMQILRNQAVVFEHLSTELRHRLSHLPMQSSTVIAVRRSQPHAVIDSARSQAVTTKQETRLDGAHRGSLGLIGAHWGSMRLI